MFPLQLTNSVSVIVPQSVATTATETGNIDTLGYEECKVAVHLDTAASTASNPTTLKLSESDDTVVSNFADITGLVGDATDGFTIPAVSASLGTVVSLAVDCRARKRYLKLTLTPGGATQLVSATAELGKAKESASATVTG